MALKKKSFFNIGIVCLFLVYVYFSDYIYGRVLQVNGESKISSSRIPSEISGVHYDIESNEIVKIKWKELIRIQGWAVDPQQTNSQNSYQILLKSKNNQYTYDTFNDERPDIYAIHKKNYTGFHSLIAKDAISDGRYRIGIINNNSQQPYLTFTNDYFTKNNSIFIDKFVAKKTNIQIPQNANVYNKLQLEIVKPVSLLGNEFIHVQCYALTTIDEKTRAYIVFTGRNETLIYDAVSIKRPDVVSSFNNDSYINSGVETYIPKTPDLNGVFKIGLLLINNEVFYAVGNEDYILQ